MLKNCTKILLLGKKKKEKGNGKQNTEYTEMAF